MMKLFSLKYVMVTLLVFFASPWAQAALEIEGGWAKPIDKSFNFYQVTPFLYRSALPTQNNLSAITNQNIKTVITFIKEDDRKWLGDDQATVQIIKYPIHADRVDDDDVLDVLKMIKQSENKGPVLLHCKHGQNRTGLFIAMYRIVVQNWTKEQAIDEMVQGIDTTEQEDVEDAMAYIKEANVKKIRKALNSNACSTSKFAFCQWFS